MSYAKYLVFSWSLFFFSQAHAQVEIIKVQGNRIEFDPQIYQFNAETKTQDLSQALLKLPGFMRTGASNRPRHFQLRGIGDRAQFEHSHVNAIGVFYAGIDLSEEASLIPFVGNENIKASYGPRSDKWGGKAIGGSIEINPCLRLECQGHTTQLGVESHNTIYIKQRSQWRLHDHHQMLLGLSLQQSDGYMDNLYLKRGTQDRDEKELTLSFQHSQDAIEIEHHHIFVDHDNGYDTWSFENNDTTLSDTPGKDAHRVHGHSFHLSSPRWNLMTSFTNTRQRESYDEDWGNNPHWNTLQGWNQNYDYAASFQRRRQKWHQKLSYKFLSALEFGIHYSSFNEKQQIDSYKDQALRRSHTPQLKSHQLALFNQWQAHVGSWLFTMNNRIEKQESKLKFGANQDKQDETHWSSRLELERKLNQKTTLHLLAQRGYRGGGFNSDQTLTPEQRKFSSESLYHAEFSLWHQGANGSALLKAFSYWYHDQQIRNSEQVDPTDPNTYLYYTGNAARSYSRGLEFLWKTNFNHFSLETNLGISAAKFSQYNYNGKNLKGRNLPHAPNYHSYIKGQYDFKFAQIYLTYKRTGESYYSVDHDHKAPEMGLVDMGVMTYWNKAKIHFYANNLFNDRYPIRAFYFANEPPDWNDKLYLQRTAPRTFGVNLLYHW